MKPSDTQNLRKRLWIVDDDETALILAQEVLSREGYEIQTFADPRRALREAEVTAPDLIVLDVMMPGIDGFEFCRRLRGSPVAGDVPVLMATSLEDAGSIEQAYRAGATNFTTKPLNWAVETHRIRYMLRTANLAGELRLKEHETRVAKEDWERTFDAISDIVTLLGPDLRILRVNAAACKALERPAHRVIGARCHEVYQNSPTPCPGCPALATLQDGAPASAEITYRHPSADCLVCASPVRDDQGRLRHVVHVARDLTQQKKLEAEYRQAQKMEAIGTLAGGVAHDFNNLLQIIIGYSQLLELDREVPEMQRTWAHTISQAALRGGGLAGQLLTFGRKGIARSQKRTVDPNQLIHDFQRMLERIIAKNVSIITDLAPDLRPLVASADQLHQVLMNMAVNASQAMPKGGTLRISTANAVLDEAFCRLNPEVQPGNYIRILISDTGCGMDAATRSRIFEPFFTTKKVGEGTGLGLSVVYGIVKDHQGHITCDSTPGRGTTFGIYLLAATLPPGSKAARPVTTTQPPAPGNETILVVDDEAALRNLAHSQLGAAGYRVLSSPDGQTALDRFQAEGGNIDLVLLDIDMPGLNGWDCLDRLRALHPDVKVLMVSGHLGEELSSQAMARGARGFVHKPCDWGELGRVIRRTLGNPG